MADIITKSGAVITDEELDRMADAAARGDYPGEPGRWIVRPLGRPALCDEELVTVTFKVPVSMARKMDAKAGRGKRSEYLRSLVERDIA